jgi:pentapeptide MXKDX repeat protein
VSRRGRVRDFACGLPLRSRPQSGSTKKSRSLTAFWISPAGSRCAHARKAAQLRCAQDDKMEHNKDDKMKHDKMEYDKMKYDKMKYDKMKYDKMKHNKMKN